MTEVDESIFQSLMRDLKGMEERVSQIEERTNILMLENDMLRLILQDICFEQSKSNNQKTRRKS